MSKNANGEGSIYKRTRNGKVIGYAGALTYLDESETSKRHTVYGRTRAEVRDKLKAARERLDAGAPVRDASRTVGDWMRQWRTTTLAASDRKESTRDLYSNLSRRHLETEPFGATRLDRLKPSDIEGLVLSMRAQTKVRGGETVRALSDSTIRQVYTVLRAGLDGAVRDGLLAVNPAAKVKRPGITRQEAKHLPADAVQRVLTAASSSRYHAALVLIAATGLRKGEALGLSWDRVDLDAGSLTVLATLGRIGNRLVISEPKTARSRRTVPLSPAVVALLRRHRVAQAEERLRAGDQWQDSGLVFTTEFGGPVDPRNLLRVLEVAAAGAGVDKVGVHTLRHSAAVAWLESGVHIKAVADLLGHSSIAITGDVYGHTSDDTARSAVAGLSEVLGL
ncbi:site-specific integrase [Gordonia alkanivorans]|uniref:tyrosine-type recombinase/integrase n=1 Tax=Gordonia alkanivorans TaxID=84096 RepID=UPI000FDD9CBD|nr:site-specific integrase [Gordonia alkanivorans]AZZ82572.1 site-specific integrase [Gordonia alkanivorans]